ncbi:hypothetical protein LXA43DRAFT_999673 [Ganoderma leucocontextum]|nr:hypothetical protein LXA43DRAFT_999673 [Ganoderma leucocontextum]
MPVLEDLNFAITDSLEQQMCPSLPIDVDLTVRRFPRLRRLALAGMVTPLEDTALYTQLRTLSLTTCSPPLSFDHFLDTLALCTQLEELCLKDTLGRLWGDFVRGDPAPCRPLISLPCLDRIVLSRHGALCTSRFLAHLHIQSSVRLDISADVNSGSPLCPCSITAMLPAVTLEPLATVNDIQLSMSTSSGPGAQSVWIRTDRTPDMVSTASLTVVLAAWGPHCGPHAALSGWGSVSDLPKVLGCSPATSLSVVNVQPDAVAAWAGVFRSCPLLERLSIQGIFWSSTCAVGIENAFLGLHAASMGADPGSPQAIACPRLAHVAVDGLETTAVYEAIRTCVRYRRDQGVARLQEIDLFLFRDPYVPSALDRACLDDILGCTERLRPRGSMDLVLSGRGGGG